MNLDLEIKNIGSIISEDQVRDLVGAPTVEESRMCICGAQLDKCGDAYDHMSNGV